VQTAALLRSNSVASQSSVPQCRIGGEANERGGTRESGHLREGIVHGLHVGIVTMIDASIGAMIEEIRGEMIDTKIDEVGLRIEGLVENMHEAELPSAR